MTSKARIKAVDCMLAKVDEIRMGISDPGCRIDSTDLINPNGDVKPVYDTFMNDSLRPNGERDTFSDAMDDKMEIDEEVEYVQNHVVFDQSTGEASSLMNTEGKKSGSTGNVLFFPLSFCNISRCMRKSHFCISSFYNARCTFCCT